MEEKIKKVILEWLNEQEKEGRYVGDKNTFNSICLDDSFDFEYLTNKIYAELNKS